MSRAVSVLVGLSVAALLAGGVSVSAAAAAEASAEAQKACESISEGGSGAIAACAQGYDAAKAGKPEEATCNRVGSGAILVSENINDCQAGWSTADAGGKGTTATPSGEAQKACESISEGGSAAIAACAQGYDAAKAGKPQEAACNQVGLGAILASENITDCQAGWSTADVAGKGTTTTPSATASKACESISEGSSAAIAACSQGYEAEKAGKSQEAACNQVGLGAILAIENINDCRAGWSTL